MTSINIVTRADCGDYLPGYEPRNTPNTPPPVPPSFVPNPNTTSPVFKVPPCEPKNPEEPNPPRPSIPSIPIPGEGSPGTTTTNTSTNTNTNTTIVRRRATPFRRYPNGWLPDEARRSRRPVSRLTGNVAATRFRSGIFRPGEGTGQPNNLSNQNSLSQNFFGNNSQSSNATQLFYQQQQSNSNTDKPISSINPNSTEFRNYLTSSTDDDCISLYSRPYNFFNIPVDQTVTFVSNSTRLDIFSTEVTSEVAYFLERQSGQVQWDEKYVSNLSIEKIGLSLNTSLLTAISNIHGPGNSKVATSTFLQTIKSHLMTGTLNEIDGGFFESVLNLQQYDQLFSFENPGESPANINLAVGIFEELATNPDYNNSTFSIEEKNDFKRMRFLPEDLNCRIEILQIDGNTEPLYVQNNGIPTLQLNEFLLPSNSTSAPTVFGDGHGYYFSTLSYPASAGYPLPTTNDLSSGYYLSPNNRANIFNLLNADPSLRLTVTSNLNGHEFHSTYNSSADVSPMYFILDLGTVGDILNLNSVISTTSATYRRVTDEEGVLHSLNYGFNISKVNVDFRDPFIHYARDTSNVHFETNEFNFRTFEETSVLGSDKIILRNIPQALIISPGCGSTHNPFNGKSNLDDYSNSSVTRTLKLNPTINTSEFRQERPVAEMTKLWEQFGQNYYGLYEQYFDPDFHGNIFVYNPSSESFNRSYFFATSGYSKDQPPSDLRTNSIEAKLLKLTDKLSLIASGLGAVSSDYGFLTWYDIFSRLTVLDIGGLIYANASDFLDRISNGLSNGVLVKDVLNTVNTKYTGLPDSVTVPDDTIIITESDRIQFINNLT